MSGDSNCNGLPMQYLLAEHAFLCPIGNDVIVLDAKNDAYLAFERRIFDCASECLVGWPDAPQTTGNSSQALRELLDHNLLTTDVSHGKALCPVRVELPIKSAIEMYSANRDAVRVSDLARFIRATAWAAAQLRSQSLPVVLERTAICMRNAAQRKPQVRDATELARIFAYLRPLAFTAKNHCLFTACALMRFLALNGVEAKWVFGVNTGPFMAHCWIQQGSVVLNDSVDTVRHFFPIMVV